MPTTHPIAQLGHPILRAIAKPIDNILSSEVQLLIDDMMQTVENAGGVGIAAPQIHQNKRLFIESDLVVNYCLCMVPEQVHTCRSAAV